MKKDAAESFLLSTASASFRFCEGPELFVFFLLLFHCFALFLCNGGILLFFNLVERFLCKVFSAHTECDGKRSGECAHYDDECGVDNGGCKVKLAEDHKACQHKDGCFCKLGNALCLRHILDDEALQHTGAKECDQSDYKRLDEERQW